MTTLPGVELQGPKCPRDEEVLTDDALAFVVRLVRAFGARIDGLMDARRERAKAQRSAADWDFPRETEALRAGDWRVAPLPHDLIDRRVEITGPVERKMIINALNSGATHFMADFEDSNAPTWSNVVTGQVNLRDAVRCSITHVAPETGKRYTLRDRTAVLLVRPRGLHLRERHMVVDGRDVPGALFDFGLYFFHNAREALARGTGPYFYLPKLEHYLEARLWNDVFLAAQEALGVRRGTVKATVLIETLPAAFQMDEILYELREHSAGLNCGRWDYIFSFIKKRADDPSALLPDRAQVTMDRAFLRAYSLLLIQTCHRRGVHAMGGMAAQIPIKDDPERNAEALERVRADKLREVTDGHDGTWVAHPGLVAVAREVFDAHMPGPHQLERSRDDVTVTRDDLLRVHEGARTDAGLRHNLRVGVQYIEAWLRGNGCVPLYNLMEDAATAEISRAQVWQWLRHGAATEDGRLVTAERVVATLHEEMERVRQEVGDARYTAGRYDDARRLFERLSLAPTFEEFLTLPAYAMLAD